MRITSWCWCCCVDKRVEMGNNLGSTWNSFTLVFTLPLHIFAYKLFFFFPFFGAYMLGFWKRGNHFSMPKHVHLPIASPFFIFILTKMVLINGLVYYDYIVCFLNIYICFNFKNKIIYICIIWYIIFQLYCINYINRPNIENIYTSFYFIFLFKL